MTSSSFPNLGDATCLPDNRPIITSRLPEIGHKNQEPLSEALFGFGTLGNPPKINHVLTMPTHVPHLFFLSQHHNKQRSFVWKFYRQRIQRLQEWKQESLWILHLGFKRFDDCSCSVWQLSSIQIIFWTSVCEYLSSLAPFRCRSYLPKESWIWWFVGNNSCLCSGRIVAFTCSLLNFCHCQCPINNLQAFSGACCILNRSQIAFGNMKSSISIEVLVEDKLQALLASAGRREKYYKNFLNLQMRRTLKLATMLGR